MALGRSPFQGVSNVIRFNWHFFAIAAIVIGILLVSVNYLGKYWELILIGASIMVALTTLISLFVTYYIYDYSKLYEFKWLNGFSTSGKLDVLNINGGFDETSQIISEKLPECELHICDFYDSKNHTEISIKRARKAYPPHPKTIKVKTDHLTFENNKFDIVFVTFAAHEIRQLEERKHFFQELRRVTKQDGKIFVTEHLRDGANFLAYTIGFLHFYSRRIWKNIFSSSNLNLLQEIKTTVFVSTFILTPNGTTS